MGSYVWRTWRYKIRKLILGFVIITLFVVAMASEAVVLFLLVSVLSLLFIQHPKWSLQNKCQHMSLPGIKLLWLPSVFRAKSKFIPWLSRPPLHLPTVLFSFLLSVCRCSSPLRPHSLSWNVHLLDILWLGPSWCRSQPEYHHVWPFLIILHFLYPSYYLNAVLNLL